MTANLLDFDLEGLAAFCERLGEKRFRATQRGFQKARMQLAIRGAIRELLREGRAHGLGITPILACAIDVTSGPQCTDSARPPRVECARRQLLCIFDRT